MSYLGDPDYFQNSLVPGSVTIANGTAAYFQPLWSGTVTVPGPTGMTFGHVAPGLTYGELQPWSLDLNQLKKLLAPLDVDPEPPLQAAPEPFSAPPRRRAMVLDGDIPVGA